MEKTTISVVSVTELRLNLIFHEIKREKWNTYAPKFTSVATYPNGSRNGVAGNADILWSKVRLWQFSKRFAVTGVLYTIGTYITIKSTSHISDIEKFRCKYKFPLIWNSEIEGIWGIQGSISHILFKWIFSSPQRLSLQITDFPWFSLYSVNLPFTIPSIPYQTQLIHRASTLHGHLVVRPMYVHFVA